MQNVVEGRSGIELYLEIGSSRRSAAPNLACNHGHHDWYAQVLLDCMLAHIRGLHYTSCIDTAAGLLERLIPCFAPPIRWTCSLAASFSVSDQNLKIWISSSVPRKGAQAVELALSGVFNLLRAQSSVAVLVDICTSSWQITSDLDGLVGFLLLRTELFVCILEASLREAAFHVAWCRRWPLRYQNALNVVFADIFGCRISKFLMRWRLPLWSLSVSGFTGPNGSSSNQPRSRSLHTYEWLLVFLLYKFLSV